MIWLLTKAGNLINADHVQQLILNNDDEVVAYIPGTGVKRLAVPSMHALMNELLNTKDTTIIGWVEKPK